MKPQEAVQIVQKQFPFNGYMDHKHLKYIHIASTVFRYLQPGSKILDFGSGACDTTAVLQVLGYKCAACDDLNDDWHKIEGNREHIFNFTKELGIDFRIVSEDLIPFQESCFDMLMMHDVLEHLHDSPRDILNDLLGLVKPEGLFFATVPNAVNIRKRIHVLVGKTNLPNFDSYYWYPGSWRGHVREYTRDDLVKLSKHLNLEVLELRSCHHFLKRLPFIIRLFYIAMTSIFTGWRDSWMLVAKKRKDWVPKKILPQNEFVKIIGKYSPGYLSKDVKVVTE